MSDRGVVDDWLGETPEAVGSGTASVSAEALSRLGRAVTEKVMMIGAYEPVVAVFGKSGVGKSSLCNALFGRNLADISHVGACTRKAQPILADMFGAKIKLIDFPGVGENPERDVEYRTLYESWLSSIDLVLWVIKVDDRAFTSDLNFFCDVIQGSDFPIERLLLVINQVDKAEPVRQWNEEERRPSNDQLATIMKKRESVAGIFGVPESRIMTVSANEQYRLNHLAEEMIMAMPAEGKLGFYRVLKQEHQSAEGKEQVKVGMVKAVLDYIKSHAPDLIGVAVPVVTSWVKRILPRLLGHR